MSRSPLVEAAAEYLNGGMAVIALTGKTPNVKVHRTGLSNPIVGALAAHGDHPMDGYVGAYAGCPGCDELKLLIQAFDHPDTTGVGILTNWPYVVVDIDGEEGAEQFQQLVYDDVFDEPVWVAKTGRGLHLWFLTGEETGTIKLGPKLDLKGRGGYVAAPPSLHPDGHVYEWLRYDSDRLPTLLPPALQHRITVHNRQAKHREVGKEQRRVIRGKRYEHGDTVFYAQSGWDALIKGMAEAEEGNRNNYLHWAAATLTEEGATTEDFLELARAAETAQLDHIEVGRTIRIARRRYA